MFDFHKNFQENIQNTPLIITSRELRVMLEYETQQSVLQLLEYAEALA